MLRRLRNLWELSNYKAEDTYKRHAQLVRDTEPESTFEPEKKLITIVDLEKPDMFPKEKTIEL